MENKDYLLIAVMGVIVLSLLWFLGSYVVFGEDLTVSGVLGNSAPVIESVVVNDATLVAGLYTGTVKITVTARDDSYADLVSSDRGLVYYDTISSNANCNAHRANCYISSDNQNDPTNVWFSSWRQIDATRGEFDVNIAFVAGGPEGLAYFANPGTDSWTAFVTITDPGGLTTSLDRGDMGSMPQVIGLSTESSISLSPAGGMTAGEKGCENNVWVEDTESKNVGNVVLDYTTSVTDLTGITNGVTMKDTVYMRHGGAQYTCTGEILQGAAAYLWDANVPVKTVNTNSELCSDEPARCWNTFTDWHPATGFSPDTFTGTASILAKAG